MSQQQDDGSSAQGRRASADEGRSKKGRSKKGRSKKGRSKKGRSKKGSGRSRKKSPEALAEQALHGLRELAIAVAREKGVRRRDAGGAIGWLTATLSVDTDVRTTAPIEGEDLRRLLADVEEQVDQRLRAAMAFRQGHVYDFLNDDAEGPTTTPSQPDATFQGYTPTGRPVWQSLTNLLIERGVERVDRLYADPPEVVAIVQRGAELKEGLLPSFGRDSLAYNVLGQVVAGLIPTSLDPRDKKSQRVALTIQLVETRSGKGGRRLRVNLIGLTPEQIVEAAAKGRKRGPADRLRRIMRGAQRKLEGLGRKAARIERRGESLDLADAVRPMLTTLRSDIEQVFEQARRRTHHAQDRHSSGKRPTSDAMRDVHAAGRDQILADTERGTLIVLGPRNRAHVFTDRGRHVTSLRLRSGELDRKRDRGRWRRAEKGRVAAFREAVG